MELLRFFIYIYVNNAYKEIVQSTISMIFIDQFKHMILDNLLGIQLW